MDMLERIKIEIGIREPLLLPSVTRECPSTNRLWTLDEAFDLIERIARSLSD